jgi:hypothetical protein
VMKDLPLSKIHQLLEPGPVVQLTTAHKGRANVMTSTGDKGYFVMGFHGYMYALLVVSHSQRESRIQPAKLFRRQPDLQGPDVLFQIARVLGSRYGTISSPSASTQAKAACAGVQPTRPPCPVKRSRAFWAG